MITNDNISYCSDGSYDTSSDDENSTKSACSSKEENLQELVLSNGDADQGKLAFGNIAVVNSSNVHFGNKTVYEGPVTIKQFLYAKPQTKSDLNDGDDKLPQNNKSFVPDSVNSNNDNINLGFDPCEITIRNKNSNGNSNLPESEIKKDIQWLRNILRQHLPLAISLSTLILLSLVILTSVVLTRHWPTKISYTYPKDTNEQNHNGLATYIHDGNVSFTLPNKLKITTRLEWLARPASDTLESLSKPVPYIIIMETQTANCTVIAHCQFMVKNKQTYDIDSQNKSDISYNYLIGGDGYAYEGVGWNFQGTHTPGYNNRSLSIAFIGTYSNIPPDSREITAANQLIAMGIELGYIDPNYKLLGSRQLDNTHNPGKLLFEEIKKWSHWSETPQ